MQNKIEGFRLSLQQKRLWLLQQNSLAYRAQCAILLEGNLNKEALKKALQIVINRHEILRTSLYHPPGIKVPVQIINTSSIPSWKDINLIGCSSHQQEARIEELFWEAAYCKIDYQNGPFLHSYLIVLSAQEHILLLSLPALHADACTLKNLVYETSYFYGRLFQGDRVPEEPIQYADFSKWQNELITDEEGRAGRDYWRKQDLSLLTDLKLPLEKNHSDQSNFAPKSLKLDISSDLVAKIKAVSQKHNVSLAILLLACWQALLCRLTDEPNIIIAEVCSGREYPELRSAFGLFAKWLPICSHLDENSQFNELLEHTRQSLDNAYEWQENFLWEESAGKTGDHMAFPSAGFEFEEWTEKYFADGVLFSLYKQYVCFDRFKVKLSCIYTHNCLAGEFYYDSNLLCAETVSRLAEQFQTLLESATSNSETTINQLKILSCSERQKLLVECNNTKVHFPESNSIHQLFEVQTKAAPDSVAIVFEEQQLTYGELNARSNQLAHYLQCLGIGPDVPVAICLEHSLEMIVGLFGTLKAGGAYVPLDPRLPNQRLSLILEDTQAPVLLTQQWLVDRIPAHKTHIVYLDEVWNAISQESSENLVSKTTTENLAYVIFTSGSTGRPKGVAVEHRQILNYMNGIVQKLGSSSGSSFALISTFAADLGNTVIFPSLCNGACLHIISQQRASEPNALADYFHNHPVDCLKIVPSHLSALLTCNHPERILPRQRLVLGGEACSWDIIQALQKLAPGCSIFNHYGPTEATVGVLTYRVEDGKAYHHFIKPPLGRPIANTLIYLLDSQLQPVPVGVPAELYIGGAGLARCYFNHPELTAEKFVPNPFSEEPGARLYKTGDLARYLPDGNIDFLGRIDQQIKFHGYRVELGEIEATLGQHPAVKKTLVLCQEGMSGDKRIVAYIVPRQKRVSTNNSLRYHKLPNDMVVFDLNKNETEHLYKQIFQDLIYLKHGTTFNEGDCIFDVGANIGLFTLFVHQICRNPKIYAFEPNPAAFEKLSLNIDFYNLDVKSLECGLSNENKTAAFTFYPRASIMSGFYASASDEEKLIKAFMLNQHQRGELDVSTLIEHADELIQGRFESKSFNCQLKTLSTVISENSIECIDLLKIDVEKSELDVLDGINESDWPKIKQVIMEVHDIEGRVNQIATLLKGQGFEVVVEQDILLKKTGIYHIYANRDKQKDKVVTTEITQVLEQPYPLVNNLTLSAEELRHFLKDKLPEYMIPTAFVMLDTLPLTSNGKLDYRALPDVEQSRSGLQMDLVAPRDSLEFQLTKVWEEILNIHPIGVTENFFELGGHSLLIVRLIAQIQKLFGQNLPLSTVFQGSTIEQLAGILRQQSSFWSQSPLVGIKPNGSKRPFFCVHPADGNVLCYIDLAHCLDPEQPFYGLQAPGFEEQQEPYTDLEQMATYYIKVIRELQPQGPYLLGGWSMGGVVAFAMAQQLQKNGQEVALLALIDSRAPISVNKSADHDDTTLLFLFARDMAERFGASLPLFDNFQQLERSEQFYYVLEQAKMVNILSPNTEVREIHRLLKVFKANRRAVQTYIPQVYPSRITLFRAEEPFREGYQDPTMGWSELTAKGVEIHTIPGNHYTAIRTPHVQILGSNLKACLDKVL